MKAEGNRSGLFWILCSCNILVLAAMCVGTWEEESEGREAKGGGRGKGKRERDSEIKNACGRRKKGKKDRFVRKI